MRFRLDPNLSAKENLWNCMERVVRVLSNRYRVHLPTDEYLDFSMNVMTRAVDNFMRLKIGQHRYNRKVDFFANCYSSAWAVFTDELTRFYNTKKMDMESVDLDGYVPGTEIRLSEVVPSESRATLGNYKREHNDKGRKAPEELKHRGRFYEEEVRLTYEDYVADCEELGIPQVDFGKFRERNGL